MQFLKPYRSIFLFLCFLLLGGFISILYPHRYGYYYLDTVAFCALFCIYSGLILFWVQSVHHRLLPSRARLYVIASAVLMLLLLIARSVKYRLVLQAFGKRCCWYVYYLPIVLVPVLFFLFCAETTGIRERHPAAEKGILLAAVLLCAGILTNDLHFLAFRPLVEMDAFDGSGGYVHGTLYYLAWGTSGICTAGGIFLLFWFAFRRKQYRQMAWPFLCLCLIPLTLAVHDCLVSLDLALWKLPEICIFCFIGVFEACLRSGLIPHNENYAGYFSQLDFPVLITDRQMKPVFQTSRPVTASREKLRAALQASCYSAKDIRLTGMEISAGYAFWEEDEGELQRVNEQLEEANEVIGLENRLIRYENEWKEERARVDARTAVYEKAAACVYPAQKRVEELLAAAEPGTSTFRDAVARISLVNAYVKRRSNFELSFSETEKIHSRELLLAMDEMIRFLGYCGVSGSVECRTDADFPCRVITDLYDSYEKVLEALLPRISRVMAVLREDGLRLTADPDGPWELPELPLPAAVATEDGYLYVEIRAERGGAG